jgi:hypothetical protein
MTRGPSWDAFELQIVARAYKRATKNNIKGADQTSLGFGDSLVRYIREMQPHDLDINDLRYSNRVNGRVCIWRHLRKTVFIEINNFNRKLASVKSKNPTGNLNEKDLHCLAIANHLKKCVGIDYNYTTSGSNSFNPATTWKYYLAYMELKGLVKFDICPQKTIVQQQNHKVLSKHASSKAKQQGKKGDIDNINDDVDDLNDVIINIESDAEDDNLPIQDEYEDENNENNENDMIPENDSSSDYHTPAAKPRSNKGIKKAKLDLKKRIRLTLVYK